MKKKKTKKITEQEIVDYAIFQGVNAIRESYGLDMSPQQLSNYIDEKRIMLKLQEIQESEKFRRFRSTERKFQFLYEELVDYVLENKPFDERGEKLLEGNLENMIGKESLWSRIFSTQRGREKRSTKAINNYLESRKVAKDISHAVSQSPELYAREAPELLEEVGRLNEVSGRGALAEILYASGRLAKDTYQNIKSSARDSSKKILELATKYVEKPSISYVTAIIGFSLILIFGSTNTTGAIIGAGNSFKNSGFLFIGVGLLCISTLSFIFRRILFRNEKTKNKKDW